MRVTVGVLRVQTNALEHLDDAIVALTFVCCKLMNIDGFAHDIADRHTRVKRSIRILKNNLHFAAVRQHIDRSFLSHHGFAVLAKHRLAVGAHQRGFAGIIDDVAIIDDTAIGRLVQAQQSTAGGGFATAGLAYQTERLALINIERNVVDCFNDLFLKHFAASYREILLKVLDFYKALVFHYAFPPLASNSFFCSNQQAL